MQKKEFQDFRNYDGEAQELLKSVHTSEMYSLLEIVVEQQKFSCSDTRRKELEAVQKAILATPGLSRDRLDSITRGYRSSMAAGARSSDGVTRPNRKKV